MLESWSRMNEEYLLDIPFTAEEVSRATSVQAKEEGGYGNSDGLLAEHLKAGEKHSQCYSRVGICA